MRKNAPREHQQQTGFCGPAFGALWAINFEYLPFGEQCNDLGQTFYGKFSMKVTKQIVKQGEGHYGS